MKSMYIGSSDTNSLLAGKQTKSFKNLLKRFVSDEIPYFNAKHSPIDALRTGAILEERYFLVCPDNYYPQVKKTYEKMDVFKCSLDFAKIENRKIVDFEELKTCSLDDFLEFEKYRDNEDGIVDFIKKKYKIYYRQIQHQLICTDLDSCFIVFLVAYSYKDEENYIREIKENEYLKFIIKRDEKVISQIIERGMFFENIKKFMT